MILCAARWAMVRVGFVALVVQAASGQERITLFDDFRLFNACRPVKVGTVMAAGFKSEPNASLRVLIERRLRIARLYDEERTVAGGEQAPLVFPASVAALYYRDGWEPDPSDLANFAKTRVRISVHVTYSKHVTDEFGNSHRPVTWESRKTILLPPVRALQHMDLASEVLSAGERAVSELLDEFIDKYLRVNGEACSSPTGAQP